LLATLMAAFGYGVERLVLRPFRRLLSSAHAIATGQYSVKLPPPSNVEIGVLSRSFGEMADLIRLHTTELEDRVRARTRELEAANQAMATAQKKIGDSIDYASMIQQATLPTRQLIRSLGRNHFVLWRPRDVVGGDFYIFQADNGNYLLGIIDCAGHGVPGALMTMLAKAAVDVAIQECGPDDPAAMLTRTDTAMRAMLRDSHLPRGLATNADAGLVYIDRQRGKLRYAGARISLYASDGRSVIEHRGGKRTLGERRRGDYDNLELPLDNGTTYYLTTDGILDQAGGEHGYGFGNQRFLELLRRLASLPLTEQADTLNAELAAYQGNRPQRDDITLLSFRFDAFTDPPS
ncbi:MAG: SpoIIE family protein phosphatase, partial [Pigmentiphaga sp.]